MNTDNLKLQNIICPKCGQKGKEVKPITLDSLLTYKAKAKLSLRKEFRFCSEADCNIIYFHPETEERFFRSDLRVRVGQKETESPRPVCYCFNHTIEEIEAEVAATGSSKVLQEIVQKCRQGLDRCQETNPQGSCCLGNIQSIIKNAQSKSSAEAKLALANPKKNGKWRRLLALLPVIGAALLPSLACPACWPAYAGFLSALGIGFFNYSAYLLPLMVIFIMVTLFTLGFRAKTRHGYYPLILGTLSSTVIVFGKFIFNLNWVLYLGVVCLIAACIWNSWPVKKNKLHSCPSCP
ncbi:MAG: MerC family mercury resistance protein [Deltaproteobacteria bacterium]|nr:MerC family mercury resistance protein [Deltaproteobacteria bacterium]